MSHPEPTGTGTETGQAGSDAGQPNGEGQGQEPGSQATDATPESGDSSGDQQDLASQLAHWKSLARKQEARAKENAKAAAKLQQIEDANKTELQKANDRAEAAERLAAEKEASHNRVMAAAMHDLPVGLIDVLGSGTEEEIAERAEVIAQEINNRAAEIAKRTVEAMGLNWPAANGGTPGSAPTAAGAAAIAGNRPVESMRAGAAPSTGGAPTTREGMFRGMIGG